MIVANVVVLAMVLHTGGLVDTGGAGSAPVRVMKRPEIPWLVVVAALDGPTKRVDCRDAKRATVRALLDAGGNVDVVDRPDGTLAVFAGPPDADAAVAAAARACVNDARPSRAAFFVEGRTSLTDSGVLRALPSSKTPPSPATGKPHTLAMAPSSGLYDVEGEALVAFVEDAVPHAHAQLDLSRGRAALVVDVASTAAAKDALAAAIAAPLPQKNVDALRARALGRIAARRSTIGTWAQESASLWLAFGTLDVDDPGADLGTRIRARLFPEVLFR